MVETGDYFKNSAQPGLKIEKNMKVLKIIGKIILSILIAILSIMIIFNLYIALTKKISGKPQPTMFGLATAVVMSGSMEPTLAVNDLILVRAQNEYKVGDIIMYENKSGTSTTTHRIVAIVEGGYQTKGDNPANSVDPDIVKDSQVVGKVIFQVAGVGLVIKYLKSTEGIISMFLVLAMIIFIMIYANKRDENKGEQIERP